jgi:hypothetical protein
VVVDSSRKCQNFTGFEKEGLCYFAHHEATINSIDKMTEHVPLICTITVSDDKALVTDKNEIGNELQNSSIHTSLLLFAFFM